MHKQIGKIYPTSKYGDLKIIDYKHSHDVTVEFINTGTISKSAMSHIYKGWVRDPQAPIVNGVGITGDKYPTNVNGKLIKEYVLWTAMLNRVLSPTDHIGSRSYKGCTVSENFKHYEYFYEWCQKQIGFGKPGWQLDKDILVKQCRHYSEDTCVFVPREINMAIARCSKKIERKLPIGVAKDFNRYIAVMKFNKNGTKNQRFDSPEEAFNCYKLNKEIHIKNLANKYKDELDPRAYIALMNYQVEITD